MKCEIEIKSLLGKESNAIQLRNFILNNGAERQSENKQLNHYFIDGDFEKLLEALKTHFSEDIYKLLERIIADGSSHSVRTREIDGVVKLVIKASIDNTSSENGIRRMEFEESVDMTLDELDNTLLEAGFQYQAKWSRQREEYVLDDVTICLDKNAGYGWLAEFELVVDKDADYDVAHAEILDLMQKCEVEELNQQRLARMFDYYNNNWEEYYGTDNIFTIE